jgi:hypothetical protein
MSANIITSSVNQDTDGNIGVEVHPQSGAVRRVPFMTTSLNVDDNGNVGVFGSVMSGTSDSGYTLFDNGRGIICNAKFIELNRRITPVIEDSRYCVFPHAELSEVLGDRFDSLGTLLKCNNGLFILTGTDQNNYIALKLDPPAAMVMTETQFASTNNFGTLPTGTVVHIRED